MALFDNPAPRILVVESSESAYSTEQEILEEAGFLTEVATSLEAAHRALDIFRPDLVLLNPELGEHSAEQGFRFVEELSRHAEFGILPVVALTSLRDAASRRKAFAAGVADYIGKPFEAYELRQRIRRHVRLYRSDLAERELKLRLESEVAKRTKELREANQRLEQLNQRVSAMDRAKSSFLQTISHELRTPANGFFGATDLLLSEGEGFDPELIKLLEDSRERLMKLIEDASLLVRLRAEIEPEALSQNELSSLLKQIVADSVTARPVKVECNHGRIHLHLNRDLFEIAIQKLIQVAGCFSASGELSVVSEAADGNVAVRVKAGGSKLRPSLRAKFFEDFAVEESDVPNGAVGLDPTIAYEATRGLGARLGLRESGEDVLEFEMLLPTDV